MAVYFREEQPPLWQNVAINLIGGLLGDAIQRGIEANRNRKENAAIADAMANAGNPGVNFMGGLNTVPEGYNDDGWQQAFHKGGTPMTQFNLGTADLVPQAQQQAMPSAWDIRQAVANTLGNPRFSMVNRENLEKLMNPYYQNAEQMRVEALRRQAAEDFGKAENPLAEAQKLAIQGLASDNFVKNIFDKYKYDNPYFVPTQTNLGGRVLQQAFNPRNGDFSEGQSSPMTLSPQQIADNDYKYAVLNQNDRHFYENSNLERYKINNENYWKTSEFEYGKEQDAIKNAQEDKRIGLQERAQGFNEKVFEEGQRENQRKQLTDELTAINTQITELKDNLENATELNERARIGQQLEQYLRLREEKQNALNELNNPPKQEEPVLASVTRTPENNSGNSGKKHLASLMAGQNVKVHSHGTFGYNRKTHKHKGADYPIVKGTPIRIKSDMGENFRVTRVNTDPKGGSGYGVYVEVEGTRNGKPVRYLMAHLKEGSVNVKAGDSVNTDQAIGQVGNTGNSNGSNGGYHLHLETKIPDKNGNWQNVDPETFFDNDAVSTQPDKTGVFSTEQQPQQNQQPQPTQDNSRIVYKRSDGGIITENQLNQMYQEQSQNNVSPQAVNRELEHNGYKRVVRTINPNGYTPVYTRDNPLIPRGLIQ